MNFKAVLTIFIFVAGLLFVAVGDADAARFGGGKSFGSKPSMQKSAPASPMMQQKAPAAGAAAGAAGAAAKPGFSMGGMMGGLLAGTLLGSLLFGGGMGGGLGGGLMDILMIGLLLFVGIKLYSRFKASRAGTTATAGGPSMGRMQAPDEPMARQESGMSWGNLQNQGGAASAAASPTPAVPEGFDTDDFLRGAKMAYTRLQAAWDKRDAADIANFARPSVLAEVQKQIEAEPTPSKTEILLVNAQLLEVKNEGAEQNAMVFFDGLLREDPTQTTPTQVREVWHFVRPISGEDSWKLDGIQQVE